METKNQLPTITEEEKAKALRQALQELNYLKRKLQEATVLVEYWKLQQIV